MSAAVGVADKRIHATNEILQVSFFFEVLFFQLECECGGGRTGICACVFVPAYLSVCDCGACVCLLGRGGGDCRAIDSREKPRPPKCQREQRGCTSLDVSCVCEMPVVCARVCRG